MTDAYFDDWEKRWLLNLFHNQGGPTTLNPSGTGLPGVPSTTASTHFSCHLIKSGSLSAARALANYWLHDRRYWAYSSQTWEIGGYMSWYVPLSPGFDFPPGTPTGLPRTTAQWSVEFLATTPVTWQAKNIGTIAFPTVTGADASVDGLLFGLPDVVQGTGMTPYKLWPIFVVPLLTQPTIFSIGMTPTWSAGEIVLRRK